MLENLSLLNAATSKMEHAGKRHKLLTNNIAHADTPDYVGKDLKPFTLEDPQGPLKATNPLHLNFNEALNPYAHSNRSGKVSAFDETINENKVDIEEEVGKAAESIAEHNFAAAVWEKSLNMLGMVLGERR